jgi:hypothetical protein
MQTAPTTRDRLRPGETLRCPLTGRRVTLGDCLAAKCEDLLPSFGCRRERPFMDRGGQHE